MEEINTNLLRNNTNNKINISMDRIKQLSVDNNHMDIHNSNNNVNNKTLTSLVEDIMIDHRQDKLSIIKPLNRETMNRLSDKECKQAITVDRQLVNHQ